MVSLQDTQIFGRKVKTLIILIPCTQIPSISILKTAA